MPLVKEWVSSLRQGTWGFSHSSLGRDDQMAEKLTPAEEALPGVSGWGAVNSRKSMGSVFQ